jgi:hypothetical protein
VTSRPITQQQPLGSIGNKDPLAWAYGLRRREMNCERLTPFQRDAWRAALGQPTSGYLDNPDKHRQG